MGVVFKDSGPGLMDALLKGFSALNATVDVGFIDDAENASKAAFNELGENERPFMRTTFDKSANRYAQELIDIADKVIKGGDVGSLLEDFGEGVAEDIQATIEGWSTPANAASTIDKKGINDPLVDTGEMRDAVTSKVTVE